MIFLNPFRRWLESWKGRGDVKPKAYMLFVDGENSPPPPSLMMDAVTSHAGSDLHLALAYGKWWPNSDHTLDYREAGIECIQADHGSNNADIMLSLRAQKEVRERAERGEGGVAYIAFSHDKGFSHVLKEIRQCRGWKSVLVTSIEDIPRILVNSCSEVLHVPKPRASNKSTTEIEIQPSKAKTTQNPGQKVSMDISFEEFIRGIIGEDSISSSTLSSRIIEYQKQNEWAETGKKELLKRFGFSSKMTYKNAIEKHLLTVVDISGGPPTYEFSLKGGDKNEPASVKTTEDKETDEGAKVLLHLIREGASNSATLGSRVVDFQKSEGWPETGRSAFNKRFGIPENQHYVTTIRENMSGKVEIYQDPALGHNYCFDLI